MADEVTVELDPVAARQPAYNTLKGVGVVRVETVVQQIEGAVLEQNAAVFTAVQLAGDAVDVLELFDALVPGVDTVRFVQQALGHVGRGIGVHHRGRSYKNNHKHQITIFFIK